MTESTRRVTIVDVAAHAGVSTAAASKVLRNAYGVSAQMRAKVESAIEELGYRPLASARGMRGKTFTIGVLVSDLHNPFFALLVDGMAEVVEASGYELLVGPGGASEAAQGRMIEAMADRQMDGLLLIAPVVESGALSAIAGRTPTVVIGRHGPADEYDTVAGDDLAGSAAIVDHLVSLGHERIAYLTHTDAANSDPRLPQRVRERGYREAMDARGLGDRIDVVPSQWSDAGGRATVRALLERAELPTAVHAGADVAAYGMLTELWDRGRSVPDEISVVGYDDTPTAALPPVSLTSVDQSGHEMGASAARLLLERFEGRTEAQHVLTSPTLIPRRTSGPPRA
ncbi:LacI family DNA-binding transcriptional regulator [Salinibacterium soli]|uniref:LacI family DNA-binding transcriptional regulator n=1 Tax=Antiquaquibacter soli TaxID=3064523 RepID=A0ABT9BP22_9MICO|nr:LacI family DNA-binding transcriptional regulator [Protaetiibacter sp. WY-16]MDO7882755.1 LacI family DNA-binding transcriptional regulator [Protaetiibacter sp. WY-16]